jgi:7-cyano-7-deazaguanine synthase
MNEVKKALVVLSGGQDSTTCLLWAKAMFDEVHAISFDYGQKHRVELEAAQKVAHLCGVASHEIVNVQGLLRGRSPLVDPSTPLETYSGFEQMDKTIGNRVELTFVPLRNLLFLVVAGNYALAKDCFTLVTGVCQMDNANYPDCTEVFILKAEMVLHEALGMARPDYYASGKPQLSIEAPLLFLSKDETVHLAQQYEGWEAALAESHTCYAGQVPPCGKCHACILRAEGFRRAGVVDPLVAKWEAAGTPGTPG